MDRDEAALTLSHCNREHMHMPAIHGDSERQRWTDSVSAWDQWAESMVDPAARINNPMMALLPATGLTRILDLAAGVGEPSISLADRSGPNCLVVASDLVASMLTALKRRASGRSASPVPLAADMTALPLGGGLFDAVLCRFGLMFVPDIGAALAEIHRVLRPGGTAVLAVWGPRPENSLFNDLDRSLTALLGPDPADMLSPLFRFAEPSALVETARTAGFSTVDIETLVLTHRTSASRPFWRPTLDMAFAPRLAALDEPTMATVQAAIRTDFQAISDADGQVSVRQCAHLVRLTRS